MTMALLIGVEGAASSVASSGSNVLLLAKNLGRKGGVIFNESTAILYVLLGSGTSSTTNYTGQVGAGVYFQIPSNYVGPISGIWASANGFARITEFT